MSARLLALPATASIVRDRLRRWLRGLGWPDPALDDVVLAVHEAVSNVIDHAYLGGEPGDVQVAGVVITNADGTRWVRVSVRDWGVWRPPPDNPGYRGRGLHVMRGCMDRVNINIGDSGTEVVMISVTVPMLSTGRRGPAVLGRPVKEISLPAVSRDTADERQRQLLADRRRSARDTGRWARGRLVVNAAMRCSARGGAALPAAGRTSPSGSPR